MSEAERFDGTGQEVHQAPRTRDLLLATPRLTETQWRALGPFRRWLVLVRAPVLFMTVASAATGILLAAGDGVVDLNHALALVTGLVAAHALNNLLNDWIDRRLGIDRNDYFRTRYGAHPFAQGLISERGLAIVVALTALPAVVAGAWLISEAGSGAAWLMAAGAFFVIFYTWPLKHWALGEAAVFIVWGPLMVSGSYFVLTGAWSVESLLLSCIAAVGPTLVILGKHVDKIDDDARVGVRSLPVVLGEPRARTLMRMLLALHWALIVCVVLAFESFYPLLCMLLALPLTPGLYRLLGSARPAQAPASYPRGVWPLWFAAHAFRYARDTGALLMVALAIRAVLT